MYPTFLTSSNRSFRNPFNSSFSMVPLLSCPRDETVSAAAGQRRPGGWAGAERGGYTEADRLSETRVWREGKENWKSGWLGKTVYRDEHTRREWPTWKGWTSTYKTSWHGNPEMTRNEENTDWHGKECTATDKQAALAYTHRSGKHCKRIEVKAS